jgi:hypothetical protein
MGRSTQGTLLLTGLAGVARLVAALGQQPIISFTEEQDAFQLAGGSISQPQILVSSNEYWGVIRAAGDLAKDFGRVTGTNFTLSNGESGAQPASYEYRPITNNYTHVSIEALQILSPLSFVASYDQY